MSDTPAEYRGEGPDTVDKSTPLEPHADTLAGRSEEHAGDVHAIEHVDHHGHGMAHVMPVTLLVGVFLALIFLTILTVVTAQMNFGGFDFAIAMAIATVKATLVAGIFMHLAFDKPLNMVFFVFCVLFVALFLSVVLLDTIEYQPAIEFDTTMQGSPTR